MSDKNNENAVAGDATAANPIEIDSNADHSIANNSVMSSDDESMAIDNKENNNENRTRNRKKGRIPARRRNEPARIRDGPTHFQNEPVLTEKGINGTVITMNKMKHYCFIKRTSGNQYSDVFTREASILHPSGRGKFSLGDKCQFDVIKTSRGYEAINIKIERRQLKNAYELPKIPKKTKESGREQTDISVDVFKSTIADLFRAVLQNRN